ncbi:APBA1 family protein [Megaselia abdita]
MNSEGSDNFYRNSSHYPRGLKEQERYVWEMRTKSRSPNITPASTVLHSPESNELHFTQQQQIRLGRSPQGISGGVGGQSTTTPGHSPTDPNRRVKEGEIVVFDDIDTQWIKSLSKEYAGGSEDVLKVTKMIGQLQINDYEGSPRRIGFVKGNSTNSTPALYPTVTRLPGFPQRVSPKTANHPPPQHAEKNLMDLDDHKPKTPTFDYLYEFSETRKVLEEFFKPGTGCETEDRDKNLKFPESIEIEEFETNKDCRAESTAYIGQRLARSPVEECERVMVQRSPRKIYDPYTQHNDIELYIDSNSRSSCGGGDLIEEVEIESNLRHHSRNFTLSPETTDYDSNCGDLDSLSNDLNLQVDYGKLLTSMPVLEDGLSSGHASDTENNITATTTTTVTNNMDSEPLKLVENGANTDNISFVGNTNDDQQDDANDELLREIQKLRDLEHNPYQQVYSAALNDNTSPQTLDCDAQDIQEALKDIRSALQRAKTLPPSDKSKMSDDSCPNNVSAESPVWIPRKNTPSDQNDPSVVLIQKDEEEELDTDLETDRLLGQQRLEEQEYPSWTTTTKPQTFSSATIRQGIGTCLTPVSPERCEIIRSDNCSITSPKQLQYQKSPNGSLKSKKDCSIESGDNKKRNREGFLEPKVLIEGVLFRAKYLGSTQLICEGQPTKSTRMMQAEEAVSRIKAPEGETQPSTEVDLFISTEKIMVLNTDLKEIMMDHALRTISYIADIGDLVVLMARRRFVPSATTTSTASPSDGNIETPATSSSPDGDAPPITQPKNRTPKMICHVFESEEAQFIAQSIGQAFQVAYMEFLKANGIEDHSFVKEMDYQEVLNSQEIFGDELEIFAKKELQKEVVVPKAKGEILGVVIVESGWGSMLPTVVIANLMSTGAAARCGQLNIGDQLIAINGLSLVGLPLSTCQTYIRNAKNQTAVKFTVVPCAPVVEVKIKRPNTKYQLGFSVQNGVICSLLRGGIAERGGVRVGHRIIEINNQSVVAVPHEKIVNLLATSVGEILMKTMPTSMFRLLTGQENPIYI